MSIDDALGAAQLAVAKAEAAATLDTGTGEASATLGTAQATVAYQLVIEILQNKVVELAPALIAVEVAAINEGIAAYLAEQELSVTIEKDVQARTEAAFKQVESSYDADRQQESAAYQAELIRERATYRAALEMSMNTQDVLQEVFDEVNAAVSSALNAATAGAG